MLSNTMRFPLSAMDNLSKEIERAFGQVMQNDAPSQGGAFPVDITETDEHWTVEADLPGFTKDQIDVTVDKQVLTIHAKRVVESEHKSDGETSDDAQNKSPQYHRRERSTTDLTRRFRLPESVDVNNVSPSYHDGVLKLSFGKTQDAQARKINL